MDRSWMKADRLDPVYEKRVIEFLEFDEKNVPDNNGIFYCPCVVYENIRKHIKKEILHHLCCDGICQNYTIWTWHEEVDNIQNATSQIDEDADGMDDQLEDVIHDIGESSYMKAHIYDTLCIDKDVPLYKGCTNFTDCLRC
ncbi:unnamed protein product [Lathyrus oleraceus]